VVKTKNRNAHQLLKVYDVVRIVNLPTRLDRKRAMEGELRRIGLFGDPGIAFFPAFAPEMAEPWRSRGERGCFLSHLAILKAARQAGQSVLILEDDCDFTDAAFDADWGKDSDIFYGGFGAQDYSDLHASNVQGSHCMGFSAAVVGPLIDFLEELAKGEAPPPIDGAYVRFRRLHPEWRTAFALPQVAVQRQSPSDIAVGRFDRVWPLTLLASIARKLNRRRYRRLKMMEGMSEAAKPLPGTSEPL
jgi:glycosyl transferase family 25